MCVVGLENAAELGPAIDISHEGPGVESVLAGGDLFVAQQAPLPLQQAHHIRRTKHAAWLRVRLWKSAIKDRVAAMWEYSTTAAGEHKTNINELVLTSLRTV